MSKNNHHITPRLIALVLLIIFAIPVAIQIPAVQKWAVGRAMDMIGPSIQAEISVGDIRVRPSGALVLRDVLILDKNPYSDPVGHPSWAPADTFFQAGRITATFSLRGLIKKEGIHLGRAHVQDGVFHLVAEPDTIYRSNIQRIFNLLPPENPNEEGSVFDIRKITVDNFRFRLNSYVTKVSDPDLRAPEGIHYEDLDAMAKRVRAHSMRFADGVMSGALDWADVSEARGYAARLRVESYQVGRGRTEIRHIHLRDKWSDIHIPVFLMSYKRHTQAFNRFVDDVHLETHMQDAGKLAMRTITGFTGALGGNDAVLDIAKLNADGYVSNLNINELTFNELTSGVSGTIKGRISGLPDITRTRFNGKLTKVNITPSHLSKFINLWAPEAKLDFGNIGRNTLMSFTGTVDGTLHDLNCNATIRTPSDGDLDLNARLKNLIDSRKPMEIRGKIAARELDLGRILGTDAVGKVSLYTAAEGALSNPPGLLVDTLHISSVEALGRTFEDLRLQGSYSNGLLYAQLDSNDPALDFGLTVDGNASPDFSDLDLQVRGDISTADLHALGIDTRGDVSKASAGFVADVDWQKGEKALGNLTLTDVVLQDDAGTYNIGDIDADILSGSTSSLNLASDFADATYKGSKGFPEMFAELMDVTARKELPALKLKAAEPTGDPGTYKLDLKLHDSRSLMAFINPDIYVADSTSLKLKLDGGKLDLKLASPRLAMGTNYLKGVELTAGNSGDKLGLRLDAKEISLIGSKQSAGVVLATADNDKINLDLTYRSADGSRENGHVIVDGELHRDADDSLVVVALPRTSKISLGDQSWTLADSRITLRGRDVKVDGFSFANGEQQIGIQGGISRTSADTLNVRINELGLAIADVLAKSDLGFGGNLSGDARLISPYGEQFRLMTRLACDSLTVKGTNAGSLSLAGRWNDEKSAIEAFVRNTVEGNEAMSLVASFSPTAKTVDAEANLNKMSPAVAAPFLADLFTSMGGAISGKLKASGPIDKLDISGEGTRLDSLMLKIAATGVTYILDGPLSVSGSSVKLDGISVSDLAGGSGTISGELTHHYLKDIKLNTKLGFNRLKVIDSEDAGQAFYGHLAASGNAAVTGRIPTINVDATIMTSGAGDVHVPLGNSLTSANSDLLTFVEKKRELDPYEEMMLSKQTIAQAAKGDFSANASVTISPNVKAVVEIDKSTGNILTAQGRGDMNVFIQPSKGILNIDGDYNITGGNFHLQTAAIIGREFTIQEGGSIKFNGDIMDSDVDVTALYNLKTSLSTLLADTTTVSTRRLVQCGIRLSDKIRNPNVGFSIDVPDLDPTTKAKVESALNTEDKVQKQFVSLLLFGTFLPTEQSGVINGSNMLYSNMSEMMSSQINSIFQKLDIPLDFGFGYQQNQAGTDIFDVAVSTQLFNNRVVVNGSLGNRKFRQSSNPNGDVVGDLDIEVKIDKSGQLRFNLFSHSADEYTSYLDFSQRNGVGLSFQKEFNKFKEIFRQRRRKTDDGAAPEQAPAKRKQVVIDIKEED